MKKNPINSKQALVLTALILLLACTLTSVTLNVVHAQEVGQQSGCSITLTPSQAPTGSTVIVSGSGFSPTSPTTVTLNGKTVGSDQAGGWAGTMYLTFTVPSVANGGYTVTASDGQGDTATAQFTVGPLATTPTPAGSTGATPTPYSGYTGGTPTYTPPYYTLPPTQSNGGGVSLLDVALIGVIVAIVVIIPLAFFMTRGRPSKRDRLLERERSPSPYTPPSTPPYSQPTSPYNQPPSRGPSSSPYSSPYNRPASPYGSGSSTSRSYSTSSSYRPSMYDHYSQRPAATPSSRYTSPTSTAQSSTYGKTCPHCHRNVKGDYSICPYCNKRLR